MKLLLSVFLFFVFSVEVSAQKSQPAMGKIDKADLEMKDCDFDKGAEALTLISWGNVYYRRGKELFNTVFEKRVRIKILKTSGLSYANVSIPYFDQDNEEQIRNIEAFTYNLDETGNIKKTEVGKSSIFSKKINKQYSTMIIAFPEARVGSVLEYRYSMERETMSEIKDWYFQAQIPTRFSEYQVNVPAMFHFTVQPSVVDPIDIKEDETVENIQLNDVGLVATKIITKNYIMQNLRGVRDEPYMGSAKDYMQRLSFQLSQLDYGDGQLVELRKNWGDVVAALMKKNDFGIQLEKKVKPCALIIAEASRLPDLEARIRLIYNYVRQNMTWNEEENIYSENGIVRAWNKKTGSTADINLLLVNLLKQAGLVAYPILFSTRENGLVNNYYPFINQFNTVMAYVEVKGKFDVLDATDKVSGYQLTPEAIVNTKGFIVMGETGEWINVIDLTHKYKVLAAVHGDIDSDGVMKGYCLVNSDEYAKKQRCEKWVKDKEKFREEYFSRPYASIKINDLKVTNADLDSLPLEQKVQFTYALDKSGDYRYFSVNLFSELEKNPFIADQRVADIDFGYLQEYTIFGSYTIPNGYTFEKLPENISMVTPDNGIVFNRVLQTEDDLLNARITVSFKRSYYPAAEYLDFAAFYKKLIAKLNEQVVIKKKPAP